MKYSRYATIHDPDTKHSAFLAINGKKVGYAFGIGEDWPDKERLPDLDFNITVKQLAKRLELDTDNPTALVMYVLREKLLKEGLWKL